MTVALRPFQATLERDIHNAWGSGAKVVMPVAATGSGKTVILSKVLHDEPGASMAIAHRQELVGQIATALARNGVRHRIVGAKKGSGLIRVISALQIFELGYSFFDPNAKTGVGGVDTIIRMDKGDDWFKRVRRGVIDEGHHVLKLNKWGAAMAMCSPVTQWLLPTATPLRADGKGLGRHADGLVDSMVFAPSMRNIIDMGYLTDYRIFAPPSDFHRENIHVSEATGDFIQEESRKEVKRANITGDVVAHYLRLAPGKLGVTFAVDVEEATKIAAAFRAAGVPAEVVSAKTPDTLRAQILRRFKNREVLQLVNVDLFGEGFDLPAIEVVSFARPTESFALFSQQFGRALRLMLDPSWLSNWDSYDDATRRYFIGISSKPVAIIIDHVGNISRHGLPDAPRDWLKGLDRRERKGSSTKSDEIPTRICLNMDVGGMGYACCKSYERIYSRCPYCDFKPEPASRSAPEYVDGDLLELDAATLQAMRGEIESVDGACYVPKNIKGTPAETALRNKHWQRKQSQDKLRNVIAWWAGLEHAQGRGDSESYRRFYLRFGKNIAGAQTLGAREADELAECVRVELAKFGIDGTINAAAYFSIER